MNGNTLRIKRECVCVCDEPITLGLDVEKEPVKSIFYKRPNKYSQRYQWDDFCKRKAHTYWLGDAPDRNWQPNYRNHPPSCKGQELFHCKCVKRIEIRGVLTHCLLLKSEKKKEKETYIPPKSHSWKTEGLPLTQWVGEPIPRTLHQDDQPVKHPKQWQEWGT